jgi:hypothetical protein
MARKEEQRGLARREKPVSGQVEDYEGFDADEDDPDAPSAEDVRRFSEVLVKCPECGQMLSDQVTVCFNCGSNVMEPKSGATGLPLWVTFTAMGLLLLIAMGFVAWRLF